MSMTVAKGERTIKGSGANYSAIAAAVAIALAQSPATAQTSEFSDDTQAIEEIVVTGSRLLRRDFSSPSPITTINREAIAFSGQATLETTLNKMPQIMPDFDRTANNPGNGTARVNLRGLGSSRTLVMLNGRRLASAGIGSSVDINSLPQALMERVEIITGGATTVYGSDAVAGVVNFVTRTDFDGFGLDASAYATEKGDSTIYDINLTYGHEFANGKGNLTLFGGYYDREPLFQSEREFTQFAWFDDGDGDVVQGGSSATPQGTIFSPRIDYGDGQGPARTIFEPNGDPRAFIIPDDFYNYAPVNYLQVPLKRYSAGAFLNYDLSNSLEGYSELTFTRAEIRANLAPVPVFAGLVINLDNPILTPATQQLFADNLFPAGPNMVAGFFGRRMLEIGPRIIDDTNDYLRLVAGLRGELTANWDFDAWVIYNEADQDTQLLNAVSFSRFQQGLLVDPLTNQCFDPSNGCVPVNMFGENNMSAEAAEFVKSRPLSSPTSRTQKSFSAFVRGDLLATWAGPIKTAFGVEYRSDEGSFQADDLVFAGDILGYTGDAPVNGKETVAEVYVEAIVPLAEDAAFADYLALELGARYSDYKNAGAVDSYKVGFEWLPNQSIRVRGMYQRSVRAPNLLEAFQEQFSNGVFPYVTVSPDEDPCSASADPVGAGNVDKCVLTGLPMSEIGTYEATVGFPTEFFAGGNPLLTPEEAETFTFGAVFTFDALPNLQFSVDYFDLRVEDTIGGLVADIACFDPANTSGEFCDHMSRDPLTFNLIEFFEPQVNKGVLKTSGIDTQINWSTELPSALAVGDNSADLVVDLIWTHMQENTFQETSFGTVFECAGRFGEPCNFGKDATTYPDDRITTNFNYLSGNFNVFLNWRWISGTDNAAPLFPENAGDPNLVLAIPDIGSKNYFDLGFGYRFSENIVARLAIANLTDTNPPFMADAAAGPNTDPGMYDLFGRSYTLSFSLQY